MTEETIQTLVARQREYFNTGATLDIKWRKEQLLKLRKAVCKYEPQIKTALAEDLGRSEVESYLCDIFPVLAEIDETVAGMRRWARPECHFSGLACFPSIITRVYKMPYGVTLILSPFNFPFVLTLGVLTAAIAGGNTAVLKASGKSKACTAVLKKLISETFSPEYVTLLDGGHDVADLCLSQRFDKIFYTGSPKVAHHIMAQAAKNLTSVALELGGETGNWCIVRADADIRDAARKIAFFKALNAGQICININQIAVAEEIAPAFLEALREEFTRQLGDKPELNPEYPKLINSAAYSKCSAAADALRERIIFGGRGDEKNRRYSPTVIYPVGIDEDIVQHELFNPLLPVVPFKDAEIDSMLQTIQKREHPLALYIFTKNRRWARKVMSSMQFGGGCINEVCIHFMVKGVPFGGTGHSGMGAYHGIWGFREFTHPQTVLSGSTRFNLPLREHPYDGKAGKWKLRLMKLFV